MLLTKSGEQFQAEFPGEIREVGRGLTLRALKYAVRQPRRHGQLEASIGYRAQTPAFLPANNAETLSCHAQLSRSVVPPLTGTRLACSGRCPKIMTCLARLKALLSHLREDTA